MYLCGETVYTVLCTDYRVRHSTTGIMSCSTKLVFTLVESNHSWEKDAFCGGLHFITIDAEKNKELIQVYNHVS